MGQIISARIKCENYQYIEPEEEEKENPSAQNHQPTMIHQEIRKIKYFNNFQTGIRDREQFNSIIRASRIKLKVLTERVLVAQLFNPENISKEDLATEILLQETKSLSESESNLLFCLAEDFETLKCFKKSSSSSSSIQEIKEEFIWIQNNFEIYLYSINGLKTPKTTKNNQNQNQDDHVVFFEGSPFCVDSTDPQSSSVSKSPSSEINEQIAFIKDLYFVDDQLVESMLSIFYLKHNPSIQPYKVLIEFCNSPLFEIKLMDFCFFFLYCPKHISHCSDNKIHNLEFSQTPSYVYQTVAENIFEFLKNYLPSKEYLIYQPKIYLEHYGIHSLKALKTQFGFEKASQRASSFFDLLVGLFTVQEISPSFKKTLAELISSLLSLFPKFESVVSHTSPENGDERPRLLALKSLELLVAHSSDTIKLFKQFPEIITHQLDRVLETIHRKVNLLYFEGLVLILQEIVHDRDKIVKALTTNQEYLSQLAELLEIISLHFTEKSHSLNEAILKQLSKGVVENNEIKTLVRCLLEISTVIHKEAKNNKPVLSALLKIGLHFYNLSCIAELEQSDTRLTAYLEEVSKKYQENLIAIILESSSKDIYYKLLPLICRKIPPLFDLTFKRKIFKYISWLVKSSNSYLVGSK